ncbi:MAG: type II toxin-antitoxin system VapC family toxin [Chloroflexi bacterium]|nr:type II toxin-antitoxin system VapC family toxin [Chloroflexota bacterium]
MNVVDSSGWLEYFADGPNAAFFAPAVRNVGELIVPSISLYEVFKRVLQQRSEDDAMKAVAVMIQGQVIDLDISLALGAARNSADLGLPMADSVILTTARAYGAALWTEDEHFAGIEGVKFVARG